MKQIHKYYLHKEYENIFVTFWKVDEKLLKSVNKSMDLEGDIIQIYA